MCTYKIGFRRQRSHSINSPPAILMSGGAISETILIVDDQRLIQLMCESILARLWL